MNRNNKLKETNKRRQLINEYNRYLEVLRRIKNGTLEGTYNEKTKTKNK